MACSCKAKSKQIIDNKISTVHYNAFSKGYKQTKVEVEKPLLYDFSTDTKPTDFCNNCIQKHLAMAVAMILHGSYVESLAAAGLLLLASLHYRNTDEGLANRCYYLALQYLQDKSNTSRYLLRIKKLLSNTIYKVILPVWYSDIETPKLSKSTADWSYPFACLLLICGAYSLMFTLMGYLNVNKAFAVGKLGRVANYLQLMGVSAEALTLRLIWKKVQLMQPHDAIYKETRKQLAAVMQRLYNKFKQDPGYIAQDVNR